jgi:chromosomal replication initiation ATPase DnaA
MYLLRKLAGCSLPHTAALLGRRDHSTAINAIARISSDLDASSEVKLDIQHLYQALQTSA